jgi:hypothetical protein
LNTLPPFEHPFLLEHPSPLEHPSSLNAPFPTFPAALARQKGQLVKLEGHNRAKEAALEADRLRYDQLDRALAEAQIEKEEAVSSNFPCAFACLRQLIRSSDVLL